MKIIFTKLVVCLMLLCTTLVYANDTKFNPSDVKAIKAALKKEIAKGKKDKIHMSEIYGNYASAVVDISGSDGGMAYLKKEAGGWKLLAFGSMITPEDLLESKVPQDIVDKFFK